MSILLVASTNVFKNIAMSLASFSTRSISMHSLDDVWWDPLVPITHYQIVEQKDFRLTFSSSFAFFTWPFVVFVATSLLSPAKTVLNLFCSTLKSNMIRKCEVAIIAVFFNSTFSKLNIGHQTIEQKKERKKKVQNKYTQYTCKKEKRERTSVLHTRLVCVW